MRIGAICLAGVLLLAAAEAAAQQNPASSDADNPALAYPRRVRATLEQRFREANTTGDGQLTFAQAQAKMPSVAHEFDAIDQAHKGYVTLDDIRAHAAEKRRIRRAARQN